MKHMLGNGMKVSGDFMLDEDVRLMLKFKEGDNVSFEALLDKYHRPIINFLYRFVGDKIEAEDLAQEVFLRVYRSAKTYVPEAKFSTWIYVIAKNLALNELRRRKSHRASSLDETVPSGEGEMPRELPDHSPSVLTELEKQDLIEAVKK
ncbi:MAG: sigma-70 family RNA polymerase sigma factor, partial [Candidatus Omnitrophota bacterium]